MSLRRHHLSIGIVFVVVCSLLIAACGGDTASNGGMKKISIGLGYNPDIQFSPFYMAQSKGYYRDAGLDVTFNHGIVQDLVGSMPAGKNDYVFVSGDELLVAREKGNVQALNVGTIFQKYPVSLIVPADSSIKTLADLKGKKIGVPGPYGATYTGLLALLYNAKLTLQDIELQSVGFTQVAALSQKQVDAVMGYSNNEPLQLNAKGFPVRTFEVSEYQPLVSNGIATMQSTYDAQPDQVRAFVQATIHGLRDVIADPAQAVEVSKTYIPTLTDTDQALKVLNATIPFLQAPQLGYNDGNSWNSMAKFLLDQQIISTQPDLTKVFTNKTVI